jgi:drug/metabolite transporter (DMT)-like permease
VCMMTNRKPFIWVLAQAHVALTALTTGILFSLLAFLCWGFGDFFIQRSTRRFGNWATLLAISLFGLLILTPLVWNDLGQVLSFSQEFWLLLGASIVLFIAALFDFEALREGKLAIVEPVLALEVPLSALLAFFVLDEHVSTLTASLICLIVAGIMLISWRGGRLSHRMLLEKGVLLGCAGALFMGASNFAVGLGSRVTNPLVMNWFISLVLTILPLGYVILQEEVGTIWHHVLANKGFFATLCLLDNAAWVAYAFAASLAPIAIVVAISESYVGLTVLLGLLVNREKALAHQKWGIALTLVGIILIAVLV